MAKFKLSPTTVINTNKCYIIKKRKQWNSSPELQIKNEPPTGITSIKLNFIC